MKTIKLLLIEDDADLGYIMKSSMEDVIGGYEVDVALNGEEGLEHYRSFAPDIIVSDIEMPVMGGYETIKKIRETDSDILIIVATGKSNPKNVTEGYVAGANNYIKKPYTPGELDAHVKALIDLKNRSEISLQNKTYEIGKYSFNPKMLTLDFNNSEKIKLTDKQTRVLELLVKHKGEIVKSEDILNNLWEAHDSVYASRSLNVFITKLRNCFSKDTSITIRNVRQIGFILEVV